MLCVFIAAFNQCGLLTSMQLQRFTYDKCRCVYCFWSTLTRSKIRAAEKVKIPPSNVRVVVQNAFRHGSDLRPLYSWMWRCDCCREEFEVGFRKLQIMLVFFAFLYAVIPRKSITRPHISDIYKAILNLPLGVPVSPLLPLLFYCEWIIVIKLISKINFPFPQGSLDL